jgi:riboflavin kinase/FMN adenylyltransferase
MQVIHFPDTPRPGWVYPVVALGNFDGVHRGHQQLVDAVRREARGRAGTSVAMIFEPHPPRVLRPDKAPPLLMTLDQKLDAFDRAGVDAVAIVRFTPDLSRWEPEVFVDTVLVDWLRAAEVWVGSNFLFGRDRTGTFTLLRTIGGDRGLRVETIEPVFYKDFAVSSTRIRHLVALGRVDEAGALLGHHYFIDGQVVRGDGRGRGLGFPTANIETDNELLPESGVYVTALQVNGAWHQSVTSVGVRPTVGDGAFTIEAFLLNGDHDLYGRRVRLAFVSRLRPQVKFDGWDALTEQMARDVEDARSLFDRLVL